MKLFRVRGGVHPDYRKEATAERAIERLPLPAMLYVPLRQHIGAPAEPIVNVGERVLKGQLLARATGAVSAPVHAPSSGVIVDLTDCIAPHPSGLTTPTLVLATDGEERWIERQPVADPFALSPDEIASRVAAAGIVGMGGAAFPAAVKLSMGRKQPIEILILNGAECEPFLTCDDRLMRERAADIITGARLMAYALGAKRIIIAAEDNKPAALAVLQAAVAGYDTVTAVAVPTRYPMGSAQHLARALTGREVPAGGRSADIGVIVHNVATAYAVQRALYHDEPLLSRVVTVSGGAVARPANIEAPLGARVADLLAYCGGLTETPARLINGGPMMGEILPDVAAPVVKGMCGIVALSAQEASGQAAMPCIRCASCVNACPCGLVPLEMAAHARAGDLEGAEDYGLWDCISCGACAYACPAHIPLVQYFQYAKGVLNEREASSRKSDRTRQLAADRLARIEQEKQAKAEAAAQRKAGRAAPKPKPAKAAPAPAVEEAAP